MGRGTMLRSLENAECAPESAYWQVPPDKDDTRYHIE